MSKGVEATDSSPSERVERVRTETEKHHIILNEANDKCDIYLKFCKLMCGNG